MTMNHEIKIVYIVVSYINLIYLTKQPVLVKSWSFPITVPITDFS